MGEMASSPDLRLAKPTTRDIAFDVVKGIAIVEVLFHHVLSFAARKFSDQHSPEWWVMVVSNRLLHFANPTFILISALLLTRSLNKRRRPDFKVYCWRRITTTVIPFLCWTILYLLFRGYVVRNAQDLTPGTWQVPGFGWVTGPTVLLSPEVRTNALVSGKGYYHLYFFSILIQLGLLLPLVVAVIKHFRPRFRTVLALAAFAQLAFPLLQSYVLKFSAPGGLIWSYLPAVLIGSWLGQNEPSWEELWKKIRIPVWWVLAVGGAVYLGYSISSYRGGPVVGVVLNIAFGMYATAAALVALAWAVRARPGSVITSSLAYLGSVSLALFVIHPMVLYFLGGPTIGELFDWLPLSPLWIFLPLLATSLATMWLLTLLRLDSVLFGRKLELPSFSRQRLREAEPFASKSLDPAG